MSNGLTGILRPNGEFLECYASQHYVIAKKIPKNEENKCIYFSSSEKDSLIYFPDELNELQIDWLKKNMNNFDDKQFEILLNHFSTR